MPISDCRKFSLSLSKCQNHKKDGANFCGLLRKAELYGYKKYFAKLYLQLVVADKVKTVCYNRLFWELSGTVLTAMLLCQKFDWISNREMKTSFLKREMMSGQNIWADFWGLFSWN